MGGVKDLNELSSYHKDVSAIIFIEIARVFKNTQIYLPWAWVLMVEPFKCSLLNFWAFCSIFSWFKWEILHL